MLSKRTLVAWVSLAVLSTGALVAAEPAPVWHDNPDTAWREAFTTGKPMFLVVSSKQCPACDKLKAGALARPDFRGWIESRFVPVVMMAEDYPHVVSKLAIKGYPTTLIVAPKVGVVHGALGVFDPAEFQQNYSVAEAAAAATTR